MFKKCCVKKCVKIASCNFIGNPRKYCNNHKLEGMIFINKNIIL